MPRLRSIVIFCRDPYVMAPFWATALQMRPVPEDEGHLASRSLSPGESVLLQGESQPDVWITPVEHLDPAGNRQHLDLNVADGDIALLVDAGATEVRTEAAWTVLADPEGNNFCAVTERS